MEEEEKRSFLQRAKKFGKSGRFGKGREIDKETYDYFLRVLEQINRGFNDDEDDVEAQEMFVENVFEQTTDKELLLAGNQLVSRVLERLLPIASHEVQSRFMSKLTDDLRRTATDPFASHVLELLLLIGTFQPPKKGEIIYHGKEKCCPPDTRLLYLFINVFQRMARFRSRCWTFAELGLSGSLNSWSTISMTFASILTPATC